MDPTNKTNEGLTAASVPTKLPSFVSLVSESIGIYKRFWKPLVKLQLFSSVVTLIAGIVIGMACALIAVAVPTLAEIGLTSIVLLLAFGAACLIVLLLFTSWTEAAAIVILRDKNENISLRAALKSAKPYIVPLALVGVFVFIAVFLGMIFFLIPGLILGVWLLFASYIVVVENEKWRSALTRSREYARGFFWSVLLLIVLGVLSIFFVNSVLHGLESDPIGRLFNFVASLFLSPLYTIYFFSIYANLRSIKTGIIAGGELKNVTNKTAENFILWLGLAGLLAAFTAVGFAVYYAPQIEDYSRKAIEEYNLSNPSQPLPELPSGTKLQ